MIQKINTTGLPFRIGTTSYIIPDDILPNLRYLADIVDDVELVLFESDEISNFPSKRDVAEMGRIAADHGLTFTVHFPTDTWPGAAEESTRRASVDKWFRVIDLMEELEPFGWIVHLSQMPENDEKTRQIWQDQCLKSLEELGQKANPKKLCVETLSYDFTYCWPMIIATGCSVCLDIGHLIVNGYNINACCDTWLHRTRVVHLHGVDQKGKDHVDLSFMEPQLLAGIVRRAGAADCIERVITLEIFSEAQLAKSICTINRTIAKELK